MDSITVSSSMLIPSATGVELTPAMLNVIWFIADELDRMRLPANVDDAMWVETPTARLRGPNGRADNVWLKEILNRLMGIQLKGEHRQEWAAVLLAEWRFTEGGTMARLLVPPAAIQALKAPQTFAKIEITAAYKLGGYARRLYADLADKKRLKKHPYWEYSLDELRVLFDLRDKYTKWYDFSRYVLEPALDEVNDFGTVNVKAKPLRKGRSVVGVRFDWEWKDPFEAVETEQENERHGMARRKPASDGSAPPLTDPEEGFRKEGTEEERRAIADKIMRDAGYRK